MKKQLVLMAMFGLLSLNINAQTYCNISTALAYTMDMPGITNFSLNTINRTSLAIECGSVNCNSYVNTGESTNLVAGGLYTVSITHTRDAAIFPDATNNLRVWIDYNNNGTLDDAGETVFSVDKKIFGTSTTSFMVPSTATLGNTRMRVTIKMSDDAGHTDPTPCDNPPDPLDYHGEFEDYTVNITSATGIDEKSTIGVVRVFPNPGSGVFKIQSESEISTIDISNVLGAKVYSSEPNEDDLTIDLTDQPKGIYFYTLTSVENDILRGRIIVD